MNASTATPPAPATHAATAPESLYQATDVAVIRSPLLPVERYRTLTDDDSPLAWLSDPRVLRAIAVGSPSLRGAVERFRESKLSARDVAKMRAKLLRYQIRMSTRPTPFGLFAGIALAAWGDRTDVRVHSTTARTRTRPDMAWLMSLVASAESTLAIRRQLALVANPLARVEAGRVMLAERAPTHGQSTRGPLSVRATSVVLRALALTRRPMPYATLVQQLCEATPSATPDRVEQLLTQLWEQTFLLTDLRPPMTTASPARYVADRLARIDAPEVAASHKRLATFLDALADWDARIDTGSENFKSLLAQVDVPEDGSKELPIQVDMALSLSGTLGRRVAQEAARAAELLLRLSPSPRGLSYLAAYRQAFLSRYGHDREVPLLELMDPTRGLGPPSMHNHAYVGPDPVVSATRARTLQQLACTALYERRRVIMLDERSLAKLETWKPTANEAPRSLDLNILIAARSADAIDQDDFTIVVGPNLGALAAGRNLGRFADLLGPEATQALKQTAAAEEQEQNQNQKQKITYAELTYLPTNLKSANVVIRPPVRAFEIPLGVSAGVSAESVVPLDELLIGVDHNRFYARWPAANTRIIATSGHMLNPNSAPPAGRFLVDIALDGRAIFSSFDWGPAESFPFLPRVQHGHIVLRPAQWRLHKDDDVARRRTQWDVPRHVLLSVGDNRLVLDLDQPSQVDEVRAELQKLTDDGGGAIILQEVVPALDEAWLEGPDGHYYSELTVSMTRRECDRAQSDDAADAKRIVIETNRLHPPGSEWLFVKLYGPRDLDEDVISGSMLTFADNAVACGFADAWFFIRYADPEPHLRLRFHGSPERLTGQLFTHVCDWAGGLVADGLCLRFMFDSYEQEIERFGGVEGMRACESIFAVDSRHAARLQQCVKAKQWPHDRMALAALSIDDFLAGLGFTDADRLRWYRTQTKPGGQDVGADYRQRKTVLRALLAGSRPTEIEAVLTERRSALAKPAARLRDLAAAGTLSQSIDTLCSSLVHLHMNRLIGMDAASESRVLSLLLRTREGLSKAPTR